MRLTDKNSPQLDGNYRWVLKCPRGFVAVEESPSGRLTYTTCLGYHALGGGRARRDAREAFALVRGTQQEDD